MTPEVRKINADPEKATPVMRQFLQAKAKHPDALLFFRMGDFYELFYDDAVIAAEAIDLTLTSRNKNSSDEIPMAGVPHHAASAYIQRLLDKGYRVAICEQMADPSKVKGIVPRDVVRVVTPGIQYDENTIDKRLNLYLAAVVKDGERFGLAVLDLSTSEMSSSVADSIDAACSDLVRWDPREVFFVNLDPSDVTHLDHSLPRAVTRGTDTGEISAKVAAPMFSPHALRGLEGADALSQRAARVCVAEAKKCEPLGTVAVDQFLFLGNQSVLQLDESTQLHLELARTLSGDSSGSLLHEIDLTRTGAGARLLRRRILSPSRDAEEIESRLTAVERFVNDPALRAGVRKGLDAMADLERISGRLLNERATPRDFSLLRASLVAAKEIAGLLSGTVSDEETSENTTWDLCEEELAELSRAFVDEPPLRASERGMLRDEYDRELQETRTLQRDGEARMVALEESLRSATQIPSLKIRYTRVFGWYLEVTRTHLDKVPETWRRKQTIANGERFTCDEVDELADKLIHAEVRSQEREDELYREVSRRIAKGRTRYLALARALAELDVATALADVAHRRGWTRPRIDTSTELDVVDGRHPVVERFAGEGAFVPNSVHLASRDGGPSANLWLLTGPNMAGKSTLMRQMALITILAQSGSFVPAKSARVGIVDRILTRVGAADNVSRGESTFMVEMKETANILRLATKHSLVLLDEIGRGTSTYDGLAIAWAVTEALHRIGCRAMFATHYHELTSLEATLPGCVNYSVSAKEHEGAIVFFHQVQKGAASRSYGVACARLAGLPKEVLLRAEEKLLELESSLGSTTPQTAPNAKASAPVRAEQASLFANVVEGELREMLAGVDVNTTTPLDALKLVHAMKERARLAENKRAKK